MANKITTKVLNFLLGLSIIILIATVIRTLVYLLIGLPTHRIFRTGLIIAWISCIVIIIIKICITKFSKKKTN